MRFFVFFRSVSSEVSSDLIVQVKGSRFLLHKVNVIHIFIALSCSSMIKLHIKFQKISYKFKDLIDNIDDW